MRKELEEEIIQNLDLDSYNLTSDDLRSGSHRFVRGVDHEGHPKVPRLDLKEIIA